MNKINIEQLQKFLHSRKDKNVSVEDIQTYRRKYYMSRSPLERLADNVTRFSGSFLFLTLNVSWFVVWLTINSGIFPNLEKFDEFPFGLLTLIVSLEAIVLTIFILISQNRAERLNDLRGEIDASIDILTEKKVTKTLQLIMKIAKKDGIDLSTDKELKMMLRPANQERLESELEEEVSRS